jgi:hypothetical protein
MYMVGQDLFRKVACASINDFYRLREYYTSVASKLYKIILSQLLKDYQVLQVPLLFHHSHHKDVCHAMWKTNSNQQLHENFTILYVSFLLQLRFHI